MLQDVYVAAFATLMLGSMLANVVIKLSRVSDDLCASAGCREGRSLLPWISAAALLVVTLAVCRLFGPVFVTPAAGSWLLPTPVDRGRLLRPRLATTVTVAFTAGLVPAAVAATLSGFPAGTTLAFAVFTAFLCTSAVGYAAVTQTRRGAGAWWLSWVLLFALWTALVTLAAHAAPLLRAPSAVSAGWWVTLVLSALTGLALPALAFRALGRLHRRDVAPGGSLAPGLSGALATLDLALMYDVLLAHRWHSHDAVRTRRGGPTGMMALAWTDLVRLRRTPQAPLLLAGAVVLPYAAETSGAGRLTVLVAALAGFLAVLPMLGALRVVTRNPSILRMLPFPPASARRATVIVPGALAVLFGLASGAAVHTSLELSLAAGMWCGVSVGLAALASAVRWVTGRPPDYSRPLVSTPAGGVPTNLYGSAVRGFDVLLLSTAPLLLLPPLTGAELSGCLSLAVIAYLTGRT